MTFFQKLIKFKKDRKGVALLIVLAAMATLSVFIGEITYTAQINQKLAYDRLDQVKAQALAKSGLKLALLRIRAYSEIKKYIGKMTPKGASAADVNSVIPKSIVEKIWSEPLTIPFSGDISSLPGGIKDALGKFRKDSGLEGQLYIAIQPQSNKFNLNSILPQFATQTTPTPAPTTTGGSTGGATTGGTSGGGTAGGTNSGAASPIYDVEKSRELLGEQIKTTFQKRMDADEKFKDSYRSYRIDDLIQDILGWCDLSYDSPREQVATLPFKKAPFYNLSELHYLLSMDDEVYDLLAEQFTTGIASMINVNSIKEPVLRALVPQMADDEVKKFFDFRDNTGENAGTTSAKNEASGDDNTFKSSDDFFKYLKEKVKAFAGTDSKITDFKSALTQRGIEITTEENNFLVRIEATVQQTKRTLEAMVSIVDSKTAPPATTTPGVTTPVAQPVQPNPTEERSNLKITQLRFL